MTEGGLILNPVALKVNILTGIVPSQQGLRTIIVYPQLRNLMVLISFSLMGKSFINKKYCLFDSYFSVLFNKSIK